MSLALNAASAQDETEKKVTFSRDSKELENFRADREKRLSKSRLRRIKIATAMIEENKNAPDMPDLLFRLAERFPIRFGY